MNLPFFRFTFFLLMSLTLPLTATAQVVDIPDPNLRAVIENALGVTPGTPITADEMATLTRLEAKNANISDLTGLEGATNLKSLWLDGEEVGQGTWRNSNSVSDLSPLAGLTRLEELDLWVNSVSDISPLAGLTNLKHLGFVGNNISDVSVLAGLTNLESLFLDGNPISGISPLAGLTELTRLGLDNISVSDLSPLAGLTNLRWMRLAGNNISDLSPLVANTGLGSGDQILLNNNPLSYLSIKTHIPTLQSRGVTVEFDDVTHLNFGEPRTVRLIYFLPNDRSSQQDIDTKLDTLIRDIQQFYADEIERDNLGRKTFTFETDATRKAVVHHVNGQFTDSYYRQNTFHKVWEEIREQFYTSQNIYFIAIDISNERMGRGYEEVCGVGDSHGASGGHVLIPASGDCFNLRTAAHELGHAFGLQHDFRSDTYIMSFGRDSNKLSECAAEWLTAHRYFNTVQSQTHFDNPTAIQMLSPLPSPPYAIGLRFEVTDPDGAHQAQLLTPATIRNQGWQSKLLGCKRLNGETDMIEIEFTTNQLKVKSEYDREGRSEVILSVIDVYGNFTSQTYPIDITTILTTETASTPNKNRSINIPEPVPPPFAVRQAFELDPFYQQWIDVEGLPVVTSAKVNPYALKEAAWQIKQMVGHRPDVLQVMAVNKARFSVIGHTELITEIPEYRSDPRPDFLVFRERGWGGSEGATISASEEYILGYPGVHGIYNVLIHEFAHGVHVLGLNTLDPTFDKRLKMTYETAMEKGLWQGTYASTDRREYWAEGSQAWFHPNSHASFDHFGNTRQALKTYDPGLAVLLTEVYGDHQWRYTPVTDRIDQPHLQGINPQSFPTFPTIEGWTELEALYRQLNKPYSDGGGAWVNLERYDPQLLPSLTKSNVVGAATCVIFVNLSRDDVLLYAVHSDGTEIYWTRASPNFPRGTPTRTNSLWLVKDTNGRNIAVFQAEEKTGRALIPIDIAAPLSSKVVSIPDANLHAVIETALGKSSSTIITASDMGYLTNLEARNANISDLTGLEGATHLTGLFLGGEFEGSEYVNSNTIANLSPVVGLTNLTRLDLWGNNISDISALADLTNLTGLWLGVNSISDISVVADLTRLTYLGIEGNSISNISAVSDLTNLTWLNLGSSSISDLSALAGLTQLKTLYLWDNNISGLSPLVANRGLGEGDTVNVQGNPLSYLSIYTHIPTLQSRGVTVEFDDQAHPALLKISDDNQKGAAFTPLSQPFVVEAQDANGSALAGVSVTFAVTAGGGTLSTTLTRTDENGRAQSTLTLGPNLGTNTVKVSAVGIEVSVTFYAISDTESPPITADVNNDGSVNILDLILIASDLGNTGTNLAADVNGDGVISILDLVLAAGMFEEAAAAPAAHAQAPKTLTAVEVQGWLTDARSLEARDVIVKRGFLVLEQLLVSLTPRETELLANYPNPFNPETWIPYRLAEDAVVTLTIYDLSGQPVRTLDVGHRIASAYENRSKAIYWNGRNGLGERVASGVYFYTLTTGDFSATRKMLVVK